MKKLIIFIAALICTISTTAQKIICKGNLFIEQPREATAQTRKTDSIFVDKDGNRFPIYKSSKGKLYIIKISKKSGKEYRKYLPCKNLSDSTKKPVKVKNR